MVKEAKAAQQQKISDLEASLAKATTDLLANRAAVSVLKGEKAQLEKNLAAQVDLLANRAAVSVLKGEKAQLEKNLAAQVEAAEGFKKDIEKANNGLTVTEEKTSRFLETTKIVSRRNPLEKWSSD
eukprot:TRINITY_DN110_c0_g1_i10.p2 TRINITY_DN110_c0_g1~~TRINITY_DN110_c0_g1_i10.p2  ORF type:complete len:126 (-),score=53.55 TRINITY_DN110_c0_g1_i10:733-1110(-)